MTLFALLLALAQPDVPPDVRAEAKRLFADAEALHQRGKLPEATARFAQSFALRRHPATAYNLGQCEEEQQHAEAAAAYYRWYLRLAPDAADRKQVEARLRRLDALLGSKGLALLLAFVSPEEGRVWVDGVERGAGAGWLAAPEGRHTVRATAAGFRPLELQVEVSRGAAQVLTLPLAPEPSPAPESGVVVAVGIAPRADAPPLVESPPPPSPALLPPPPAAATQPVFVVNRPPPPKPPPAPRRASVVGLVVAGVLGAAAITGGVLGGLRGATAQLDATRLRSGHLFSQAEADAIVADGRAAATESLVWWSAGGGALAAALVVLGASL